MIRIIVTIQQEKPTVLRLDVEEAEVLIEILEGLVKAARQLPSSSDDFTIAGTVFP